MPDREKVIKGLREMSCRATWKDIDRIRDRFQPIINDAIALLKEQQNQIWEFQDQVEYLTDKLKDQETANLYKCPNCGTWVSAENVVRCKDCKFGEACKNGAGEHGVMCYNSQSANHSWVHEPDWFCADGEGL